MTKLTGFGAMALLASLGACGSADETAEDTAPAAEMAVAVGPYAESEMAMHAAMEAAVGVDAADTWVKKMIAHHEGAIDMSRIVLGLEPTADVIKMAQMTIDNQGAEIKALNALALSGTGNSESAKIYETAESEMHREMMAASRGTPSETYLAKMLAHHRGAVAMSDIALANGATGSVRTQILETRAEQVNEVAIVEAMLRGEPMPASEPSNSQRQTAATPLPKPLPAAATPKSTTAKSAPAAATPKPTETPIDPHAGHDMSDMDGM